MKKFCLCIYVIITVSPLSIYVIIPVSLISHVRLLDFIYISLRLILYRCRPCGHGNLITVPVTALAPASLIIEAVTDLSRLDAAAARGQNICASSASYLHDLANFCYCCFCDI